MLLSISTPQVVAFAFLAVSFSIVLWNPDPPATRCVWEDTSPGLKIGSVRSEVKVMQLKEISSCGSPPSASGESVSSKAAMRLDEAGRIMDRFIDLIAGRKQQTDREGDKDKVGIPGTRLLFICRCLFWGGKTRW